MKKGIYMWYGISSPPKERMKEIADSGFDTVMLYWGDDDVDGFAKEEFLDLAVKYSLEVENAHLTYRRMNRIWEDTEEGAARYKELFRLIVSAGQAGIPRLVTHVSNGYTPPSISELGLKRFCALHQAALEFGTHLAFENLKRPDYLRAVGNAIGNDFSVCYDVGHNYCFTPKVDVMGEFGDKIIAVHLHDNFGDNDSHLLPLDGNIPLSAFSAPFVQGAYRGSITLEVNRVDNTPAHLYLAEAYRRAERIEALITEAKTASVK